MNELIINQLNRVDWNFTEKISGMAPKIHWYPGTFPSEIPSTIIQGLSQKNDIVFDPYGGIGTTATEAIRLGRRAFLTELNIVALLIAYTECGLILLKSMNENYVGEIITNIEDTLGFSTDLDHVIPIFKNFSNNRDFSKILLNLMRPNPDDMLQKYLCNKKPQWKLLSNWIEKETLEKIKNIWGEVVNCDLDSFSKLLCITMLSAILRKSSSQIKSWGHISDNVYPKKFEHKNIKDICKKWLKRIERLVKKVKTNKLEKNNIRVWIEQIDWITERKKNILIKDVDLLITSPPYANAIDYIRAQRLSFYLLGFTEKQINLLAINEIGARRKRSKSNSKIEWAENLKKALNVQLKFLSKKAKIALILPHKDSGREIGSKMLNKFLLNKNWNLFFNKNRSIDQLSATQSWTSIKKETIKIYCQNAEIK